MAQTHRMPSREELEKRYGRLLADKSLNNVADWILPNHSKEFNEEKSLESLPRINNAFKKAMGKLFNKK
ncbi:MAG: hypothetical protein ABW098_11230 [Candidatus Thiodiazotropha sp.]